MRAAESSGRLWGFTHRVRRTSCSIITWVTWTVMWVPGDLHVGAWAPLPTHCRSHFSRLVVKLFATPMWTALSSKVAGQRAWRSKTATNTTLTLWSRTLIRSARCWTSLINATCPRTSFRKRRILRFEVPLENSISLSMDCPRLRVWIRKIRSWRVTYTSVTRLNAWNAPTTTGKEGLGPKILTST